MKRHPSRRRSGIAVPAFLCLLFAAVLLLGSRAGGDAFAQKILGKLAQNETFVSGAFALGTGQYPGETSVHAPRTATAGLEQEPTDEDLAELDMAMENAGLEPQAPVSSEPQEIPEVKVNNQSGLDFDLNAMLQNPKTITATDDGPQVLVYHTHATEAYTPSGSDTYEASGDARTLDTNQNVVRVGTGLCNVLEERGIKTVHLTDLNDYPSYNGSYGESLRNVQAALEKYPTVKMTIDVHRDAILADDGTKYKLACEQNGQTVAQLMLVMGTNASGLEFDDWSEHLNYAVTLQSQLNADHPGLMRSINLRKQRFNLHLTTGSMLLEVGSSGNTLQEALASVRLFGDTLATYLGAPKS